MQPPLLVDWLKQLHLTADAALASKRWGLANSFAAKARRADAILLLRLFLFPEPSAVNVQTLTRQLLDLDSEFPASNNSEEVRLMSGIIMIAALPNHSSLTDVFLLGMKAAAFPTHRCSPAQRGIIDEMATHLDVKANELRPSEFLKSDDGDALAKAFEELGAAAGANDPVLIKKRSGGIAESIHGLYGKRLQRLSEETSILWWLLGAYSPDLDKDFSELSPDQYSLVAAAEVAARTQLLPPPPSVYPILSRALAQCKGPKRKKPALKDVIQGTDEKWRSKFVSCNPTAEWADLTPLMTALAKVEDSGDISALPKALQKACPGVSADLTLPPIEAARQLYNELMFAKALSKIS